MFRPRCLLKRSANNNRRLKKRVSAVDSTPQFYKRDVAMFSATELFDGKCTTEANLESFATDVLPLFSASNINCMSGQGVQLGDYDYMSDPDGDAVYGDHANARHVYG